MSQKRTSRNTSINSTKCPAIYSKLSETMRGKTVVDYGCGRYIDHLKAYGIANNVTLLFYDPYNMPADVNAETVRRSASANFAICSNVLNVIDDEKSVTDCIVSAVSMGNGHAFFTVYEGNGNGRGQETQNGESWQRNEKLKAYARFVPDGMTVSFHRGLMEVKRG